MKILMITPYLPYPLYSGGQIRTYNLLKNLAKKHQITLFSFVKNIDPEHIKVLSQFCQKVEVFKRRKAFSIVNLLLAGLTFYPFLVAIYYSANLKRKIRQELEKKKYDLIHAETFYVMPNIPKTQVPILLVEQTIEYLVYDHFVQKLQFPLSVLKLFLNFDVKKIKLWEKHFWQKAGLVVAMSASDRSVMRQLVPALAVEIIPNGIDPEFFGKMTADVDHGPQVLFVGNFSWLQNREAVYFLVHKIWPKVKKAVGKARLWIVGRNPNSQIKDLATDYEIVVDDTIEDIRSAYGQSSVLLAPIFGPGGTRFKILEAMASGLPVVTTLKGIEGIPAKDGVHVLIGSTAAELSRLTIEILNDSQKAQNLANNARSLAKSEFSWAKISQSLSSLYDKVAHIST